MSKRKRSDDVEDGEADAAANFRQQRRIMAAFSESTKNLSRAFKLAKGLEQQKTGRRLKTAAAKKDQKDMDRINAEKAAIKALENTLCAQHYLAKSLLKIKAIATSPDLPVELSKPVAFPRDAASLNVNGRLCKSKPVQEALPAAVRAVKREFGIRDEKEGPVRKKRVRAKDFEGSKEGSEDEGGDTVVKVVKKRKRAEASDSDALSGADPGASDEESGEEFEQYQHRLAASSDEEEDGDEEDVEVSDIEDLERQLEQEALSRKQKSSKKQRYDPVADLSLSDEESEDESVDERPPKKGAPAKVNKSSFIPSLTMGGYISGSGSDFDDEVDIAPKKNRRGQRARQKIWEQKYKAKANHLKNQDKNAGWDPKRGAVERQPRFAKGANSMPLENKRRNVGASDAKKPPRKDDSGPLHPSWEAAKRAKEKREAPVPFQGKKISFD
ncbi:hypothetical protein PRZ48_000363 [Zasmidium cellare]|uniref:Bud22 domain-containing protein n=1 Tax=Zasmidium cellare TaxID=395010 RepID=A0ABR0EZV1_ZASCE|nr:hypothetical protein PRZ48_000363 [Zasmidium cellare]